MVEIATKRPVKTEEKKPEQAAERSTELREWRPFESLRRELGRLFDDFGRGFWRSPFRGSLAESMRTLNGLALPFLMFVVTASPTQPVWAQAPDGPAAAVPGKVLSVVLASVTTTGLQGNQTSDWPIFLPGTAGDRVAFTSLADTFDPGQKDNTTDIFIKNLTTGAMTIVSTRSDGTQSYGGYGWLSLSRYGNLAAYESGANDLVPHDTIGSDIFVRDMQTRVVKRVSTTAGGLQANGDSWRPQISLDGKRVVFASYATNLVAGDTNKLQDVFVKELATGKVIRASVSVAGVQGNGESTYPIISPAGRYVVFESVATNLIKGKVTQSGVFLKDLSTGNVIRLGRGAFVNRPCCAFSNDGKFLAFAGQLEGVVAPIQIYIRNMTTGQTVLASTSPTGTPANNDTHGPSFSPDAKRVVFQSKATNLFVGNQNTASQIYVKDLVTGAVTLVSRRPGGLRGNHNSFNAVFSRGGNKVAFTSCADNLVAHDSNDYCDVFVATIDFTP